MQKFLLVSLTVFIFGLAGCSKPAIDTTNDETTKSSIQKARGSLPESKRAVFDQALQILMFSEIDMKSIMSGSVGAANMEAKMKATLNGKTAEEVMDAAEKIKVVRAAREREQALSEIQELEKKRLFSEKSTEELKKFVISRSRFYLQEKHFLGKEPVIELTVKNGTAFPVSRAYFVGVIASPGRSVPWLKETFNYEIQGGLEPDEEATWKLSPNMFSDWGKVEAPADAVFTVTTERLDGASGEALFSTTEFNNEDAERLAALKGQYGIK